jgi:hypothetical protein
MTKLDAYESALLLAQMAVNEVNGRFDLRSQLAVIRLKSAIEALKGNVDIEAYEQKIIGPRAEIAGVSP